MPEAQELYQDEPALTKLEGVPEGPQRKNHVVRPLRVAKRDVVDWCAGGKVFGLEEDLTKH